MKTPRRARTMGEYPALYIGLIRRLANPRKRIDWRLIAELAVSFTIVAGCVAFIAYTIYFHFHN